MQNELVKEFGREVIIAEGRGKRPHLHFKPPSVCPFCKGNEHMTPPETGRVEENGDWFLRSFENKYVILSPKGKGTYGKHEVIVESPSHTQKLEETDVLRYLNFCFERMNALKDDKIKYVLLFKNYGFHAGASIPHAHSQIVALPEIPPEVMKEKQQFEKGYELKNIVFENKKAMCVVPNTPRFPYEMWIAPKERVSTEMSESQKKSFADALKKSLIKLSKLLDSPDYCFFFHYYPEENNHYHLHLEITPRISIWAGFEMGSGILVNSIPPRIAVEELSKA